MEITSDDQFDLQVNGQPAGKGSGWGSPKSIDLAAFLNPGKNIFAVGARNVGNNPNPAGVLAKLKVEFKSGGRFTLITDNNWKSATNAEDGWKTAAFDDAGWVTVKVLGEYGTQSWGIIQSDDRPLPARYLRREFSVEKKVRQKNWLEPL